MSILALSINEISIRQDNEGRYCLNDLHKSAGAQDKHRPTYWLKNQQTIELQKEIEIDGIPSIVTKQGLGTFVVKELVYAYAMWISAAFALKVIRAYDALVTTPTIENPKAPRAKTFIPGGFTCEEQDILNDFIAERVAPLPKVKQPKAVMNMRSALVSKWDLKGVKHGYKNIPSEHFTNALNLMARVELDGDSFITIPKDELNLLVQQEIKAIQGDLLPKPTDNVMTINISNDGVVKSLSLKFECNEFKTGRWLVSQDNGNVSIQHLPDDVCVFSFQQWIQYAKQERGYVVLRKDEVVTKLVA